MRDRELERESGAESWCVVLSCPAATCQRSSFTSVLRREGCSHVTGCGARLCQLFFFAMAGARLRDLVSDQDYARLGSRTYKRKLRKRFFISARQSKSCSTSPNGLNVLSVFTVRVVALRAVSSVTVAVSDVLMGDGTNAG